MVAMSVITVPLQKVKCTPAECVITEAALNAPSCAADAASVCACFATKNTRSAYTRLHAKWN